jgi:hypothetical protein
VVDCKSFIFTVLSILFVVIYSIVIVGTPVRANAAIDDNDATACLILEVTAYEAYVSNTCNHKIEITYCVQSSNLNEGCENHNFSTETINGNSPKTWLRFAFVDPYSKVFFLACINPWSAENVRMENGGLVADKCSW